MEFSYLLLTSQDSPLARRQVRELDELNERDERDEQDELNEQEELNGRVCSVHKKEGGHCGHPLRFCISALELLTLCLQVSCKMQGGVLQTPL